MKYLYHTSSYKGSGNYHGGGGRKTVKSRGSKDFDETVFSPHNRSVGTHEFSQDQASQNASMNSGEA